MKIGITAKKKSLGNIIFSFKSTEEKSLDFQTSSRCKSKGPISIDTDTGPEHDIVSNTGQSDFQKIRIRTSKVH